MRGVARATRPCKRAAVVSPAYRLMASSTSTPVTAQITRMDSNAPRISTPVHITLDVKDTDVRHHPDPVAMSTHTTYVEVALTPPAQEGTVGGALTVIPEATLLAGLQAHGPESEQAY